MQPEIRIGVAEQGASCMAWVQQWRWQDDDDPAAQQQQYGQWRGWHDDWWHERSWPQSEWQQDAWQQHEQTDDAWWYDQAWQTDWWDRSYHRGWTDGEWRGVEGQSCPQASQWDSGDRWDECRRHSWDDQATETPEGSGTATGESERDPDGSGSRAESTGECSKAESAVEGSNSSESHESKAAKTREPKTGKEVVPSWDGSIRLSGIIAAALTCSSPLQL